MSVSDGELDEWFARSKEERVLDVLEHVLTNVRDMSWFGSESSPLRVSNAFFPAYIACVESFWTNVRLGVEFLVRMPARDFTAKMFVPDWRAPEDAAEKLNSYWELASSHVAHFGRARVPTTREPWRQIDMSYDALQAVVDDLYQTAKLFAAEYVAADRPLADRMQELVVGVRPYDTTRYLPRTPPPSYRPRAAATDDR